MLTPDQIEENRKALSRGVNEALAKDLGCNPNMDVMGLFVDRALAQAGMLPPEALAELTTEERAVVCAGMTEDEVSANVFNDKQDKQGH